MNRSLRQRFGVGLFVLLAAVSIPVRAHSASDAYLTLEASSRDGADGASVLLHGQWDIALRDLDFVLGLDGDGDGKIVWAELRKRQADIARYAFASLHMSGDGNDCVTKPTRQLVDNHADGAYAALFFDVVCTGSPRSLRLDYRLFFTLDPSHRGILVFRSGASVATALLSPGNASIDLAR